MDALENYIKDIERNPDNYCDKIKRAYLGRIKPIVQGKDPDFYYDPAPGTKFIRFCQGDIVDQADLDARLADCPGKRPLDKLMYYQRYNSDFFTGMLKLDKDQWAGRPMILAPYQKAYVLTKYGIKWRKGHGPSPEKDNQRRFEETFLVVGRKNGKTTLEQAEAIYGRLMEPGAEVYVTATTFQIARRTWDGALSMIQASPVLSKVFKKRLNPRPEIYYQGKGGQSHFYCLSSAHKRMDGLNPSRAIIDEGHALPREIYDVLKQGRSARVSPILSLITTSGFLRGGLFDQMYKASEMILNNEGGALNFLPLVYELDKDDDPRDEKKWIKANPALGLTKKVQFIRDEITQTAVDPNAWNTIKTKDFNRIGVDNSAWLSASDLDVGTSYPNEESLAKTNYTTVVGGFDLAVKHDTTAFATLIPLVQEKKILCKVMIWVSEDFLETETASRSGVPWRSWIDRGLVRIGGQHFLNNADFIPDFVREEYKKHRWSYQKIGYDAWHADEVCKKFVDMGFLSENQLPNNQKELACMTRVEQSYKGLTEACSWRYGLLKAKRLDFMGNPVVKWMLSNRKIVNDHNGNMRPDRIDSGIPYKIDGGMAILDALSVLLKNKDRLAPGIFEGGLSSLAEEVNSRKGQGNE